MLRFIRRHHLRRNDNIIPRNAHTTRRPLNMRVIEVILPPPPRSLHHLLLLEWPQSLRPSRFRPRPHRRTQRTQRLLIPRRSAGSAFPIRCATGSRDLVLAIRGIDFSAAGVAFPGAETIHVHQLVEDDELDGEFDGVGKRLRARFVDPFARVDFADEGNVEEYAENVQVYEELLRFADFQRIRGEENLERGADVDDGDDEFLQSEDYELDALVNVVDFRPHTRVGLVGAEGQGCGYDLEEDEVCDYHYQNGAQHAVVAHDEVEP